MTYFAPGLFCVVWGEIIASTEQPLILIDAVSLLAVLFLVPLYGFGLFAITKLLSPYSRKV